MLNDFQSKTLCLIPARKSSKRIKKKNKKLINGKPLIFWTINFAKKFFKQENIYVSSDDKDILNISKKNKINFIKRPKKYSLSKSKSIDVAKHCLDKIRNKIEKIDNIILLQPTSPFRKYSTLKRLITTFIKKDLNSIITVSRDIKEKKNLFYMDNNFRLSKKKSKIKLRINGNLYLTKISYLKKYSKFYENNSKVILTKDKLESLDIDVYDDWKFLNKNKKSLDKFK